MDGRILEWIGRLGRLAGAKAALDVRKVTPASVLTRPGEAKDPETRASQPPHRYGVTRKARPRDAE